ncbi:Nse4 C-terminal-domain-containing protein [Plectosphaerella plurivora]|uniref:Non-structural maintenance of chromosomes element 4 n=1 Tax=Plectosphaerella plurivora TaxID=936078 RepID=A0A9P9ADE0_9PEZI|nr:Nse4 C-terminal-domain-containing protein [Plectosphaerella plurivora]
MPASDRSSSPEEESGSDAVRSRPNGKRKRADTTSDARARRGKGRAMAHDDDEDEDEDGRDPDAYDPDQSMADRRRIQRGFRDLQKDLTENLEEYMQPSSKGLKATLDKAQKLSDQVKQTNEATIDSRLLVTTVDLTFRKTMRLVQGANSQGLDPDEFVSKCITYMRRGGGILDDDAPALSSTQRNRRRDTRGGRGGGEDEDDEMFNWSHLGRFACLPQNRRPALTGFLVGPLSVEKKVRKIAQRMARFRKEDLEEVRPEVLDVDELAKKENDVAAICSKILKHLDTIQTDVQQELADIFENESTPTTQDERDALMGQYGMRDTGGIDLLRFVVNPRSFSQTVENMFYVSFLIRDGKVKVEFDKHTLPQVAPMSVEDEQEAGAGGDAAKHQAIFSMDMKTWQEVITAFDIREPMIPHRKERSTQGPGARGWYS